MPHTFTLPLPDDDLHLEDGDNRHRIVVSVPTDAEMAAYARAQLLGAINPYAAVLIEKHAPMWKQNNLIREGRLDHPVFGFIDKVREASNRVRAAIDVMGDEDIAILNSAARDENSNETALSAFPGWPDFDAGDAQ